MRECGGNVVLFAIYMKMKYPESKIYSFEPTPNNLILFRANTELLTLQFAGAFIVSVASEIALLCPIIHLLKRKGVLLILVIFDALPKSPAFWNRFQCYDQKAV